MITAQSLLLSESQSTGVDISPLFIKKRLILPNLEKRRCIPIAPTNGGIIIGRSKSDEKIGLPLKFNL